MLYVFHCSKPKLRKSNKGGHRLQGNLQFQMIRNVHGLRKVLISVTRKNLVIEIIVFYAYIIYIVYIL